MLQVSSPSPVILRRWLRQAWADPLGAVSVARMLAAGWYVRLRCRLRRQRVLVGRNFRVSGRLDIRGPGTVIFGDDCTVISTPLAPVTPYTHDAAAVIRIGDRVVLNGTRLGCQRRIEIGDDALLADARIMDTDFHRVDPQGLHRWSTTGESAPVRLEPGVWVCAAALVLKGVTVGRGAVVGAGAVVARDVPPHAVVAGNPARVVRWVGERRRAQGAARP